MKTQFKNVIEILDYYKSEEKCKQLLIQQRWNGKPACPHCASEKVYITDRGYKCANKECYKKFSVISGSIFENTKIKLRYWFAAIYLITAHKKGISSHQLAKDLGVTQKTAWFILQRVRAMLKDKAPQMLSSVVEIDETYVGGKAGNKHAKERKKLREKGTGYIDKAMVFGILERQGKVFTQVVPANDGKVLKPIILDKVKEGAIVMTDGFGAYKGLDKLKGFQHEVVNHHQGEYFREGFHTNSIEGYWSIFKRGIIGIYHYVSPKHLHRYCDEFTYRYNTRHITDNDRFISALTNADGVRLKYTELTKIIN